MKKQRVRNILFTVSTLILSTLLAFAFEQFNLRRENILLIYVASIMLIMVETRKVALGIVSTFLLVFVFNFFFTEPKYTFIIADANYIITLIIFMVAIAIMGTLTTSLQREINFSKDNGTKMELLYQMSKELLFANTKEEILRIEKLHLSSIMNRDFLFHFTKLFPDDDQAFLDISKYKKEIEYATSYHLICGKNESKYAHLPIKIFPITSTKGISGVLIVNCEDKDLSKQEKEFIQTSLLHMLIALEREKLSEDQEHSRLEIEKERLKSALLRSISHDIRTPLTTLQTGTSFLYESFDLIEDDMKKNLLLDINNETSRMSEFVENLLNMTRLNANQLILHLKDELIDDILMDVNHRIQNRLGLHKLVIEQKENMDYVYTDATLLIQVLTNLIDNAIRHTRDDATIQISYHKTPQDIEFQVIDDGGGIIQTDIHKIFSDFVSIDTGKGDKTRGIGLGLSICQAIIKAHGGTIKAQNNDIGGATFSFTLPSKQEVTNG